MKIVTARSTVLSPHRSRTPCSLSLLSSKATLPLRSIKLDLFPAASSSILSSVETFDGSQIIDPVVVSNVFWTSLQAKLLSVFLGQLLAVIVFAMLTALTIQQLGKITDWVSTKFSFNTKPAKRFRKMPPQQKKSISIDLYKLTVCIIIDLIGSSSELLPVVGELSDVVWAPIAAFALRSLFGSNNVIFVLEFVEEILPFTDFLPLATICWTVETFFADSNLAKLLQVGQYSNSHFSASTAIEVPSEPLLDEEERVSAPNKNESSKTKS